MAASGILNLRFPVPADVFVKFWRKSKTIKDLYNHCVEWLQENEIDSDTIQKLSLEHVNHKMTGIKAGLHRLGKREAVKALPVFTRGRPSETNWEEIVNILVPPKKDKKAPVIQLNRKKRT